MTPNYFAYLCIALCVVQAVADDPITVRAKRQQCRCIRNPLGGGLTCSCGKPSPSTGISLLNAEHQQQTELAQELTQAQSANAHSQAHCTCLQIVFHGNPQYQCHCGDENGNPLPSATSPVPTTTTELTTTTTPPSTTTPAAEPIQTVTQGQGQCQCIMIKISGPVSTQYQCNCQNTPTSTIKTEPNTTLPPATTILQLNNTKNAIYPPIGTINSTEQGCFCIDPMTKSIDRRCGCYCNCLTLMVSLPNGVCACPQDSYGQPVHQASDDAVPSEIYTTLPPLTNAPEITTDHYTVDTFPMTTTCVMYVGVQATPCTCLPQYDQCASNVCCLKSKFRSHKNIDMSLRPVAIMNNEQSEPSTIDMLVNVLQKIKTKLNN